VNWGTPRAYVCEIRRRVPRVPATELDRRVGRIALGALLGAATIRILAAVIAGFITLGQHDELNIGRLHAGVVLNAFGASGDGIGALLVAAIVAVTWGLSRRAPVSRTAVTWVRVVATITALMTVASAAAVLVLDADANQSANQLTLVIGFSVAYLLVCLGGLLVLSEVHHVDSDVLDPDHLEPLLFAVDRGNGEVFAFFSFAEARRTISIYSIEEDEYVFYTDEGMVVNASAADGVTHFTVTTEDRREDLMRALRQFALAKALTAEEPGEPTSYAVPIADWQWLELWPGWLRPIGRLVRRVQASAM
jgi:hypothetical protein